MSKKKKSGSKKTTLEKVLLATAILELLSAVFELLDKLLE